MKALIATALFLISSLAMAGGAMRNAPNPYDLKAQSSQNESTRQDQYSREQRESDEHERREREDRERREHGDSRQGHYR